MGRYYKFKITEKREIRQVGNIVLLYLTIFLYVSVLTFAYIDNYYLPEGDPKLIKYKKNWLHSICGQNKTKPLDMTYAL